MVAKACIIGDPVAHSRSPMIHNYWLKELGLEGTYQHAHVKAEALPAFLASMQVNGFRGGNCTIPHKEAAFELCDQCSDAAQALGAVNTIWFEDNKLCGDNTDVTGFLTALDRKRPDWERGVKRAVVLGAGGAARAILFGLIQRRIPEIFIVNRSVARASALAAKFGATVFPALWGNLDATLKGADLLVNSTSLGMTGQPAFVPDLSTLSPNAIVDDIVYVPLETGLLAAARARNLTTVDGLDMLLYQAVQGFERWFGEKPEVTEALRRHILADIERH